MGKIELKLVQDNELTLLHRMQVESFMPLYEKYHDEGNPAIETLDIMDRFLPATGHEPHIVHLVGED